VVDTSKLPARAMLTSESSSAAESRTGADPDIGTFQSLLSVEFGTTVHQPKLEFESNVQEQDREDKSPSVVLVTDLKDNDPG
jgi:hypothetical protein